MNMTNLTIFNSFWFRTICDVDHNIENEYKKMNMTKPDDPGVEKGEDKNRNNTWFDFLRNVSIFHTGCTKKMQHSDLYLFCVLEVGFCFSRYVLESEFQARFI